MVDASLDGVTIPPEEHVTYKVKEWGPKQHCCSKWGGSDYPLLKPKICEGKEVLKYLPAVVIPENTVTPPPYRQGQGPCPWLQIALKLWLPPALTSSSEKKREKNNT